MLGNESESYQFDYRRLVGVKRALPDAQALLERMDGVGQEYLMPTLNRSRVPTDPLTFSNSSVKVLLDKIAAKRNFELDGKLEVAQGIVPNHDVVSARALGLIPYKKRQQNAIEAGQGVFVVSDRYFADPSTLDKHFLKPLYEPSDIGRYAMAKQSTKHIIYSTRTNTNHTPPSRSFAWSSGAIPGNYG